MSGWFCDDVCRESAGFRFEKGRELKHREAVDTPYLYLIYATMIGLFSYDNAV